MRSIAFAVLIVAGAVAAPLPFPQPKPRATDYLGLWEIVDSEEPEGPKQVERGVSRRTFIQVEYGRWSFGHLDEEGRFAPYGVYAVRSDWTCKPAWLDLGPARGDWDWAYKGLLHLGKGEMRWTRACPTKPRPAIGKAVRPDELVIVCRRVPAKGGGR